MNLWCPCPSRSDPRRDGSVLIPVMMIMLLLAYLGLRVSREIAVDYAGAAYLRSTVEAGDALDYGEFVARNVLLDDLQASTAVDSLLEDWANPEEAFKKATEALALGELGGGITDEQGLLPINQMRVMAARDEKAAKGYQYIFLVLTQTLMDRYGVEGDPQKLLRSVLYWIGDKVDGGGDDGWYGGQDSPYARGKDFFTSPDELALVRFEDVEPEDWHRILFGENGGPGLADYISVWSQGPINMNTAPEAIVRAIAGGGARGTTYWIDVRDYRTNERHALNGSWHLARARALKLDMAKFPSSSLGTTSKTFRVQLLYRTGPSVIHRLCVMQRGYSVMTTLFRVQY